MLQSQWCLQCRHTELLKVPRAESHGDIAPSWPFTALTGGSKEAATCVKAVIGLLSIPVVHTVA